MISLGLTKADEQEMLALSVSNHAIDIQVQILDLEHKYLADASTKLLSGQVTMDDTSESTTRSLSLTLLDPLNQLKLDGEAPEDGSLYFTRMIKINYGILNPSRSRSFYVPIFCGPLSKVERDGPVLSLTAVGKEKLMSANMWVTKTYKAGQKKTDVIKNLLRYVGGETKYEIPDLPQTLSKNWSLTVESIPWVAAKELAQGMGYQLFYDGRGVARMRKPSSSNMYTFSDQGALLTEPQVSFDAEAVINAVMVTGGKPKSNRTAVWYKVIAPASHPLSPAKLGRNGVPRYLPEYISDDSLKSIAKCKSRALSRLTDALIEAVDVAFDSLPIVVLEERDLCTVSHENVSTPFRMSKMTIPLIASGTSSVGYLKNVYKKTATGGSGGGGKVIPKKRKKKKKKRRR